MKSSQHKNLESVLHGLLIIVIISMVFGFVGITNVATALCFIIWLALSGWPGLVMALQKKEVWAFLSIYLLNILGLPFTNDYDVAGKQLLLQLPILIFPFIFSNNVVRKPHLLLIVFVISCFLASIAGFISGYLLYLDNNYDSGFLYSDNITFILKKQAVYFAVYINVAIIFTLYLIGRRKFNRTVLVLLLLFFIVEMFMLASRISIGTFIAISAAALISYIVVTRRWLIGTAIGLIGIIAFISLASFFPKTINRFKSIMNTEYNYENTNPVDHFNAENQKENWNGLTIRLAVWNLCNEIIKENPFLGVGTGDYKDALVKKYEEYNFYFAIERNLNTHNQYYHIGISFGILGLLLFISCLAYLITTSLGQGNYLFFIVMLVFLFSFITETFLNRTNGVMLFGYIAPFLFWIYQNQSEYSADFFSRTDN